MVLLVQSLINQRLSKPSGERIVVDLQLGDPLILVSSHCDERSFREDEGLLGEGLPEAVAEHGFLSQLPVTLEGLGKLDEMNAWNVLVHGGQNEL